MSASILKQKMKDLLHKKNCFKIISRNDNLHLGLEETLINTSKRIKRNNTAISMKYISPFQCFQSKSISAVKPNNKYEMIKNEKHLRQIKIFDEINNLTNLKNNLEKINFKTIDNFNHCKNINIRTLKKYNSFKGFNKGKIHILNKKPIEFNNELFKFDKKFLKEISPINNFININKKIDECKKEKKRKFIENKKDNFYFDINSIRDKNGKRKKFNFKHYNSNKNFIYPKRRNDKLCYNMFPSYSNYNNYIF